MHSEKLLHAFDWRPSAPTSLRSFPCSSSVLVCMATFSSLAVSFVIYIYNIYISFMYMQYIGQFGPSLLQCQLFWVIQGSTITTPSGQRLMLVDTSTPPTLWSPSCCQSPSSCTLPATFRSRTASELAVNSAYPVSREEPFLKPVEDELRDIIRVPKQTCAVQR